MEKQRRRKKGLHILVEGDYFWEDHGEIYTITRPLNEVRVECDLGEKIYLVKKMLSFKAYKGFQFSSVTQSCLPLCDPMYFSMPGFPVHHQLLEPTQTHGHHIGDAIQPSYPLLSTSPSTFKLSQHQGLFK